jgi:hypothetical protein
LDGATSLPFRATYVVRGCCTFGDFEIIDIIEYSEEDEEDLYEGEDM